MDKNEIKKNIEELKSKFDKIINYLDPTEMSKELRELEKLSQSSDFWSDPESSQETMQKIGSLRNELDQIDRLSTKFESAIEILNDDFEDKDILEMLQSEYEQLEKNIESLELRTFLSGKFDKGDAIITINAGTGGTEAMDWTEMLLRMYTRYCNSQDWKVVVTDKVDGPEAGISTVTFEVKGTYAYGYLKNEHGTHRLVRISPFNAAGQRQTSFAGVEVSPMTNQDINIEIPDTDIDFQAVRSSGAGGQSVNKTSSAVRIRHKPTGILVAYSGERSQLQNREAAMKILKAKLYLIEEEKRKNEELGTKGEYKQASWGNQIRNYVLQPYKLVKDTRTGAETSNSDAVLDGDLQLFIDEAIRKLN